MFRETSKSEMNSTHFGVGSIIIDQNGKNLLIETALPQVVQLIDLNTFKPVSDTFLVEDVHYLTEKECRNLVYTVDKWKGYAFSDLDFDPKGLKV